MLCSIRGGNTLKYHFRSILKLLYAVQASRFFFYYNLQTTCNFLDLSENKEPPCALSSAGGNL